MKTLIDYLEKDFWSANKKASKQARYSLKHACKEL